MKRVSTRSRSVTSVAIEWDKIAAVRARQIGSGTDHSAVHVLAPAILSLLRRTDSLLDVGCGTGWLTAMLSDYAKNVVGVDASKVSIRLARASVCEPNVSFVHATLESFQKRNKAQFSAAVANMTLGTTTNLLKVVSAVGGCLKPSGVFIFTIPHPCFWPTYWGYAESPWFNYMREMAIAAPFRIGTQQTEFTTTHVHRPLMMYLARLRQAGFELDRIEELVGRGFRSPRFIVMKWRYVPRF